MDSCSIGPNLFDKDPDWWNCSVVGPRTPGPVLKAERRQVASWVHSTCTASGNCNQTRCCSQPGMQCFEKTKSWASCMPSCTPGVHPDDPVKEAWSCNKLGPRTPGLWQYPSIFCWYLTGPWATQRELVSHQFAKHQSIFGCDEWVVFSDVAISLGYGVWSTPLGDLTCSQSKSGTWLNAVIYTKAWHSIFYSGQYKNHEWIIKTEPETLFFPERFKKWVRWVPSDLPWYVKNNPDSKDVTKQVLAPIEALTRGALDAYFENNNPHVSQTDKALCENPQMNSSSEDALFSKCMNKLGYGWKAQKFMFLNPSGRMCRNYSVVAFSPLKTVADYEQCHFEAMHVKWTGPVSAFL